MSLITLRRYLNAVDPPLSAESTATDGQRACIQECLYLVSELNRVATTMVPDFPDRQEWDAIVLEWKRIAEGARQQPIREQVGSLLDRYSAAYAERERVRTREMQQMLTTLNDALLALASGSDKSIERLRQVETSLTRASQMDDIVALKSRLTDTVKFVRAESEQQAKDSQAALRGFEQQFRTAQQAVGNQGLGGRAAALAAIDRLAKTAASNPPMLAMVCQAQRLRAMQSRYGASIAEEILRSFVRQVVEPGALAGLVFLWKEDTLLWFAPETAEAAGGREVLQSRLAEGFEHRTVTGGRTAVLKVMFRSMARLLGPGGLEKLPKEIDDFLV